MVQIWWSEKNGNRGELSHQRKCLYTVLYKERCRKQGNKWSLSW